MTDRLVDFSELARQYPLLTPFFLLAGALLGTYRISLIWMLLEAVMLGLVTYAIFLFHPRNANPFSLRGYLRFTFPKQAYLTRSTLVDALMLFGNAAILRSPYLLRFAASIGMGFILAGLLTRVFGPGAIEPATDGGRLAVQISLAVAVYLFNDFGDFISHYAAHRVPWLWAFHRVHHSAETLTPLTAYREHPLMLAFFNTVAISFGSIVHGVYLYLYPSIVTMPLLLTGNLVTYLLFRTNFLLGHFNVPVSFGVFEKVIVSPAIHRVHHALEPRYHDKNFGGRITLWDRLFGTFHLPTRDELENMPVGLENEPALRGPNPLPLYWEPVVVAFKSLPWWKGRARPSQELV